jgi:hypothetical protein
LGITAYDASLVLQQAAGALALSGHQTLAADVNRNGIVSAMDASYILEKSVGLLELPFPGAGQVWDFAPNQRSYALLSGDQANQDFTAILLGDVSGNWGAASAVAGGEPDPVVLSIRRTEGTASASVEWWLLARIPDAGLHSLDLVLELDGEPFSGWALQPEELAGDLVLAMNDQSPGRLRVAAAGARSVNGLGALLRLTGNSGAGQLRIAYASADEGRVAAMVDGGGVSFDQDTDGDRQTDWHEVLSGTDPNDRRSVLAIARARRQTEGEVLVEWPSVFGHRYRLQSALTVAQPSWVDVGPQVTAAGEVCSQTDRSVGAGGQRFYRVVLGE